MKQISKSLLLSALSMIAVAASAQVRINELSINPPGADQGFEFIELKGTPGMNLDGYWFLSLEGDGAAAGLIDQAIPLTGQTIGSNGLFLIRDAGFNLVPNPDPSTNLMTIDFNPDLENGSGTWMIVRDYTGYVINGLTNPGQNNVAAQTDIDANNDGVPGDVANQDGSNASSTLPWTSVLDAVGVKDAATDLRYAGALGFANRDFDTSAATAWTPDTYAFLDGGVVIAADYAVGASMDNLLWDGNKYTTLGGTLDPAWVATHGWTPGSENPTLASARTVTGVFSFGDWVGSATNVSSGVSFDFEILDATTQAVLQTGTTLASAADGSLTITLDAGVTANSVLVALKGTTFLRRITAVTLGSNGASGVAFTAPNGNVNGDTIIDLSDYLDLVAAFDSSEGGGSYSANADLNKDAVVDLGDYLILVGSFDLSDN